jgi:hypothetical protein
VVVQTVSGAEKLCGLEYRCVVLSRFDQSVYEPVPGLGYARANAQRASEAGFGFYPPMLNGEDAAEVIMRLVIVGVGLDGVPIVAFRGGEVSILEALGSPGERFLSRLSGDRSSAREAKKCH